MIPEILFIGGAVVLFAGAIVVIAGATAIYQHLMFWATTWRARREGRKQYAAKGWNTVTDDIPEGAYVVATWQGWRPEICKRKGDRLESDRISFMLNDCVGWLELPELNNKNSGV